MRGDSLTFAFAAALLFAGGAAAAAAGLGRPARSRRAEAEFFYRAGVDQYAYGRFPEALASFQEALRRDPRRREARIALVRVREELALKAAEAAAAPRPAAPENPRAAPRRGFVLRSAAAEFIRLERKLRAELRALARRLS